MKISIVLWTGNRRIVCIDDADGLSVLTVTKVADHRAALIKLPYVLLDVAEAKTVITALELAAKVAGYLDELEPDEALDAIKGLPVKPYDGWRPMPRAGRTEN